MSAAVLLVFIFICFCLFSAVAAVGVVIITKKPDTSTDPPKGGGAKETVELKHGWKYVLSDGTNYLAYDFDDSRDKGKMCNAATTTDRDKAAPLKLTKSGSQWIVATDCDQDGNYTSYLTAGKDLIEAKNKDDASTQKWTIDCTPDGCGFKNDSKGWLNGTFDAPTWLTTNKRLSFAKL